ncbi:MAG: TIGR03936 family radical SAM-associated protein [Lachnospiraceae bacterium]|nr:TIGR03936 family radical SAM-associated protein [Lachnospiraceae bacterium]
MKIRIKFRKYGVIKFIGHLDMMRYFQKAMRRADIDIVYSEGFSPHQIMSFAAPLGVGIVSDGEYFDIEVHSSLSSQDAVKALNQTMVEGVEVLSYRRLPDDAKTAMSIVSAADYQVYYKNPQDNPFSPEQWQEAIKTFYEDAAEILVTKKTKKSEKQMDLKQLVYCFQMDSNPKRPCFFLRLSTGSIENVKPELLLETFYQSIPTDYEPGKLQIHRREVYTRRSDGSFLALEDMGEDILA